MEANEILEVVSIKLGGIPCLYVKLDPIMLIDLYNLYHGWSSNRKQSFSRKYSLSRYEVIIPDLTSWRERSFRKLWSRRVKRIFLGGNI